MAAWVSRAPRPAPMSARGARRGSLATGHGPCRGGPGAGTGSAVPRRGGSCAPDRRHHLAAALAVRAGPAIDLAGAVAVAAGVLARSRRSGRHGFRVFRLAHRRHSFSMVIEVLDPINGSRRCLFPAPPRDRSGLACGVASSLVLTSAGRHGHRIYITLVTGVPVLSRPARDNPAACAKARAAGTSCTGAQGGPPAPAAGAGADGRRARVSFPRRR